MRPLNSTVHDASPPGTHRGHEYRPDAHQAQINESQGSDITVSHLDDDDDNTFILKVMTSTSVTFREELILAQHMNQVRECGA